MREGPLAVQLEAAADGLDPRDSAMPKAGVEPTSLANVGRVGEKIFDTGVVAARCGLKERSHRPAPPGRTEGEPRKVGRRKMTVGLGAHPSLPDRGRLLTPLLGRVGMRPEDDDLFPGQAAVPEGRERCERSQAAADDRCSLSRVGRGCPRQAHLTEPARRPWTKYRWNAKNTASGTSNEMNDAGAIRSMFAPNWRRLLKIATVIGCTV